MLSDKFASPDVPRAERPYSGLIGSSKVAAQANLPILADLADLRIEDFFGFFGALKKGAFFGVDQKKLPRPLAPPSSLPAKRFLEVPPGVQLMSSRRSPDGVSGNYDPRQKGDFFGVHPKKGVRG
jgi:hypothetical protein